jgi:hypothetical protein
MHCCFDVESIVVAIEEVFKRPTVDGISANERLLFRKQSLYKEYALSWIVQESDMKLKLCMTLRLHSSGLCNELSSANLPCLRIMRDNVK